MNPQPGKRIRLLVAYHGDGRTDGGGQGGDGNYSRRQDGNNDHIGGGPERHVLARRSGGRPSLSPAGGGSANVTRGLIDNPSGL